MRKLITIILLFITSVSFAQNYNNTGTANLQRAPTAKGYIYRNNMGALGNVNWYTNLQIDSLINVAIGSGVTSFNGRTGSVTPIVGDYSAFYPLLNGTGATGTWNINISGNATTVTNGVYTTTFNSLGDARYPQLSGSYTNPSWIVSLPYTKITGTPSSLPPSGAAGGSLAGTYPNPTIASSVSLPGSPTTTTQSTSDSTGKLATTAFVKNNITNSTSITTTVSGLRAIGAPLASVLYQTTDFGSGNWFWNPTDTTTENIGTVIKPTIISGGGRFNRVFTGAINVKWFGAKGDGTTVDDAAFTAATYYLTLHGGGKLYIPYGTYIRYNPTLIQTGNVEIYGDGTATIIKGLNPTKTEDAALNLLLVNYHTDFLSAGNRISNISVHDLQFDQSSITPVMLPKWDANSGSGQPKYYAFNSFACVIFNAVDNLSFKNVTINRAVLGGVSFLGCYNPVVDNYTMYGLHNVRVPGSPQLVYNGNGISAGGLVGNSGNPVTYTGPQGGLIVSNSHIIGKVGAFPDTAIDHNLFNDAANIGIQSAVGSQFPTARSFKNTVVVNTIIENCIYGFTAEGLYAGGAGDAMAGNNTIKNCLVGATLYGDNLLNANDSYNVSFCGNRFEDILFSAINIFGNHVIASNNQITNWGIAKSSPYLINGFGSPISSSAIYAEPFSVNNTGALSAVGLKIDNNICLQTYVNDFSYMRTISGIYLQSHSANQTLSGITLSNNSLDANKSTHVFQLSSFGIELSGYFNDVNISGGYITGFANGAMLLKSRDTTDATQSPSRVSVRNVKMYDNANFGGAQPAITVLTSLNQYTFENLDVYETGTSHTSQVLSFKTPTFSQTSSDYITVKDVNTKNLTLGAESLDINTSGTHVYISGLTDYSNRTAAPTSTTYRYYQGTMVYNSNPSTGILGWVCTASGAPGTWVVVYTKTGSDAAYVSSVTAANTTLTISPTVGNVIAGLNLSNANTFTPSVVGGTLGLGLSSTHNSNANNQNLVGYGGAMTFNDGGFTGNKHLPIGISWGTSYFGVSDFLGGGTIGIWPTSAITTTNYLSQSDQTNNNINIPGTSGNLDIRYLGGRIGRFVGSNTHFISGNTGDNGTDQGQFVGTVISGIPTAIQGGFKIAGSAGGTFSMLAPSSITTYSLTTPGAAPSTNGQVISYTTAGIGSWVTPAAGSVTSVSSANSDIGVATGTTTPVLTFNRAGAYTWTGNHVFNNVGTFNAGVVINPSFVLQWGTSGNFGQLVPPTFTAPVNWLLPVRGGSIALTDGVFNQSSQTATYAILTSDYYVDCNGTFTATLPTAIGAAGKTYIVTNAGAGIVTVATTGGQTINGSATATVAAGMSTTVHSNGSNWLIN